MGQSASQQQSSPIVPEQSHKPVRLPAAPPSAKQPPAKKPPSSSGTVQPSPQQSTHQPLPPGIHSKKPQSATESLFEQAFSSLQSAQLALKNELSLSDLVIRERSERIDLLFHLLDESLASPDAPREFVELADIKKETVALASKELQQTLAQTIKQSEVSSGAFGGPRRFAGKQDAEDRTMRLAALRSKAPSASFRAQLLAMITDLCISQGIVAVILALSGFSLPLRTLQLITAADDLSAAVLLIAFLLPSFCLYRILILITTGTTIGFTVYGITPITMSGSKPSRFDLICRAATAPFVGLLGMLLIFSRKSPDLVTRVSGVRVITETSELIELEREMTAQHA